MRCRTRLALSAASSLATVLAALAPSAARADDDPFPLDTAAVPKPPTSRADPARPMATPPAPDYTLFVSATVNGRTAPRMVRLVDRGGQLYIERDSAGYLGLRVPEGQGPVALTRLEGVSASFDAQRSELSLSVSYLPNAANVVRFRGDGPQHNPRLTPTTALVVDYDLVGQTGPDGTRLSGQVSPRLVRGNLALSSSWTFGAPGRSAPVRLDTALTLDLPGSMLSLTAGDFVQAVGPNARAVRLGGLQIGSNFALRPDFITYPLPDFSGNLAVPQQLDLIVNDRRFDSRPLEAGSFSLQGIPVGAGRGQLGVVVRDALGREQYLSLNYYVSNDLLAPGLDQWAINAGFVRRRFGLVSDDYGRFATSLFWRRGITPRLTLGANAAAIGDLRSAGIDLTTTLGHVAQLSLGITLSQNRDGSGTYRGSALTASLASAGRPVSVRLGGRLVSSGYDDLASSEGQVPPASFLSLSFDFDLGQVGGLSLSAVSERDARPLPGRTDRAVRHVVSLGYGLPLGRANLFVAASWRRSEGRNSGGVSIGLSLPLGPRERWNAGYDWTKGGGSHAITGFDRPAVVDGDVGYGFRFETGRYDRAYGQVGHLGSWGAVSAEGEVLNGEGAARLSLRGAVVVAGGDAHAVRDSGRGMVLIDTGGLSGITFLREHQPAARRSAGKAVLIAGLTPRVSTRIGIDRETLPASGVAESLTEVIAVPGGTVMKLDLGLRPYEPRLVRLLDTRGEPFPVGTAVRMAPSGTETIVGIDGMVEVNTALPDRVIEVRRDNGAVCQADLEDLAKQPAITGDTPALRCFGEVRPMQIGRTAS